MATYEALYYQEETAWSSLLCFQKVTLYMIPPTDYSIFSFRHIASFLSIFKLVLIGFIIIGKDPFAFFGMQAPSLWQWGQENKVNIA